MAENLEQIITDLESSLKAFEDICKVADMPEELHAEPGSIVLSMRAALQELRRRKNTAPRLGGVICLLEPLPAEVYKYGGSYGVIVGDDGKPYVFSGSSIFRNMSHPSLGARMSFEVAGYSYATNISADVKGIPTKPEAVRYLVDGFSVRLPNGLVIEAPTKCIVDTSGMEPSAECAFLEKHPEAFLIVEGPKS